MSSLDAVRDFCAHNGVAFDPERLRFARVSEDKSEIIKAALTTKHGMTPKLAAYLETRPIAEVRSLVNSLDPLSSEEQHAIGEIERIFAPAAPKASTAPGVWNMARLRAARAGEQTIDAQASPQADPGAEDVMKLSRAIETVLTKYGDDTDVVTVALALKDVLKRHDGTEPDAARAARAEQSGAWTVARLRAARLGYSRA